MRCGPKNVFKRQADALLIDIGVNDVGFAGWAAAIILKDPLLREAASAQSAMFRRKRPLRRYAKTFCQATAPLSICLRTVLDQYLLPDFGIDPSHVIVAVYPPAWRTKPAFSVRRAMPGLTIATFPLILFRDRTAEARGRRFGRRAGGISGERPGREGRRAGAGEAQ